MISPVTIPSTNCTGDKKKGVDNLKDLKKSQLVLCGVILFIGGILIGFINPISKIHEANPGQQAKNYQQELRKKNKELAILQDKYDKFVEQRNSGKKIEVNDSIAKKFFVTILEFDETNWHSRFETAQKYGSTQAINFFNPDGFKGNKPSAEFKETVNSLTYYPSFDDQSKGLMVVNYKVATGMSDPMTVVAYYQITLDNSNKVSTIQQVKMQDTKADES